KAMLLAAEEGAVAVTTEHVSRAYSTHDPLATVSGSHLCILIGLYRITRGSGKAIASAELKSFVENLPSSLCQLTQQEWLSALEVLASYNAVRLTTMHGSYAPRVTLLADIDRIRRLAAERQLPP